MKGNSQKQRNKFLLCDILSTVIKLYEMARVTNQRGNWRNGRGASST